jgi:hypothetical protein
VYPVADAEPVSECADPKCVLVTAEVSGRRPARHDQLGIRHARQRGHHIVHPVLGGELVEHHDPVRDCVLLGRAVRVHPSGVHPVWNDRDAPAGQSEADQIGQFSGVIRDDRVGPAADGAHKLRPRAVPRMHVCPCQPVGKPVEGLHNREAAMFAAGQQCGQPVQPGVRMHYVRRVAPPCLRQHRGELAEMLANLDGVQRRRRAGWQVRHREHRAELNCSEVVPGAPASKDVHPVAQAARRAAPACAECPTWASPAGQASPRKAHTSWPWWDQGQRADAPTWDAWVPGPPRRRPARRIDRTAGPRSSGGETAAPASTSRARSASVWFRATWPRLMWYGPRSDRGEDGGQGAE